MFLFDAFSVFKIFALHAKQKCSKQLDTALLHLDSSNSSRWWP